MNRKRELKIVDPKLGDLSGSFLFLPPGSITWQLSLSPSSEIEIQEKGNSVRIKGVLPEAGDLERQVAAQKERAWGRHWRWVNAGLPARGPSAFRDP